MSADAVENLPRVFSTVVHMLADLPSNRTRPTTPLRPGAVLDSASVRRAAVEDVSETVIAAIYLLHERSVADIVVKLRPGELEQVIRLVSRCPSCYPPGTLDALNGWSKASPPAPGSKSAPTSSVASRQPGTRTKPSPEDMRRAKEGRLARLRAHASRIAPEPERVVTQPSAAATRPARFSPRQSSAGRACN
jgi:hypothetical protein